MTFRQFKGAILAPQGTILELLSDKENSQSWMPGIKVTALFQLLISLIGLAAAWALLGLLLGLSSVFASRSLLFGSVLEKFFSRHLSPAAFALNYLRGLATALVSSAAFSAILDLMFQKIFDHKGRKTLQVFNVTVLATLPWTIFVVIPVLGWIILLVGILLNIFKVIQAAYAEKDGGRVLGGMLVAGVGAWIPTVLVAVTLHAATGPLLDMDPTHDFITGLTDQALGSPAMSEADKQAAALRIIAAAMGSGVARPQQSLPPQAQAAPPLPQTIAAPSSVPTKKIYRAQAQASKPVEASDDPPRVVPAQIQTAQASKTPQH
jgi:hypothetical protein